MGNLQVVGQALKPFGVKGEIKIRPFTQSFEIFARSDELVFDQVSFRLVSFRVHRGTVLATLQGIDSVEQAKALCGKLVKTDERNFPPKGEDEFYWFELIGMSVRTIDGKELGTVAAMIETGANDVLEVHGDYGEVLIPLIDDVVVEIRTEDGAIIVDPLDGLIPDA
jgi:16S rRNA processing protein RimM